MRAFSEELFGPVAVLYRVSSEDEAVEQANNSVYGLGAVIQSTDAEKAREIADRLDTGMVYINEAPAPPRSCRSAASSAPASAANWASTVWTNSSTGS